MLFGNAVITVVYLIYHWTNAINALAYPDTETKVEHSLLCQASWYVVAVAVHLELLGYVAIAYMTYRIVVKAGSGKRMKKDAKDPVLVRVRNIVYIVSFVGGVGFAAYGTANNHLGSFKGLYCANVDWNYEYGGYMVFLIVSSFMAMGFFFLKAMLLLQKQAKSTIGDRYVPLAGRSD
jgi:hypothetical protein